MKITVNIFLFLFLSCNVSTNKKTSYWEGRISDFKYQDKKLFVSNNDLRNEFKELTNVSHPMFDSLFGSKVYLYSWQNRSNTKNEFTVVKDDGELGLKIFYFILDKADSLICWEQIAGKGAESLYWFETWTTIKNKDTLINIGAITQWYDLEKNIKMANTVGDSTFAYLIIDENGKITEHVFKEVKDLNFDNQ